MNYSKEQLIEALYNEYDFLCHDDFDPEVDLSPAEYLDEIREMTYDELIAETQTDETFTLDEFMEAYG